MCLEFPFQIIIPAMLYICVSTVEAYDISQLGFYLSSGISADQVRTF